MKSKSIVKIISITTMSAVALLLQLNIARAEDAPGVAAPASGEAVYKRLCVTCHGPSGKGDGVAAAALNPKPKDLSVAKAKGDDYLKKVISQGGAAAGLSATMPAWSAALKPGELEALVAYIHTL